MKDDLRDERLGAILDAGVRDLKPAVGERLPRVLRRGSRRRAARWAAAVTALTVFVGGVGWIALIISEGRRVTPLDTNAWTSVGSLDTTGWMFRAPPGWLRQGLPACPNEPERTGAIVTNVNFVFWNPERQPPDCEDRLVLAGFPSDGVAIALQPVGVRTGVFFPAMNTPFPISFDQLEPTEGIAGGPSASYLRIGANRENILSLRTWIGPDALPSAVDEMNEVIASLEVLGAARWTTYRDEANGFEVTHPDDWNRAGATLTPELADPREILSIGTYPMRPGGKACVAPYLPGNAIANLGAGDVFITVQESLSDSGFPRRPESFGPPSASISWDGFPACDGHSPVALRGWWIPFAEEGRGFYAFLALGSGVTRDDQVLRTAWHILDRLRFDPAPTYPRGALEWCPDVEGTVSIEARDLQGAAETALQFARASLLGDVATAAGLQDDSVPDDAVWSIAGEPQAVRTIDVVADGGGLVEFGCGPNVAARTASVSIDDGTESASLDFTLYLVLRPGGWKVWSSY